MAVAPAGSIRAFTESFLELETRCGLFSLQLRGRAFWDYIRYAAFYECVHGRFEHTPSREMPRWRRLGRLARAAFRSPGHQMSRSSYDAVVVNFVRNRRFAGRSVNIQTYPVLEGMPPDAHALLVDPSLPQMTVDIEYPADVWRSWRDESADRARARLIRYTAAELDLCAQVSHEMEKAWSMRIDIAALLPRFYSYQLVLYDRTAALLARFHPRVLLFADTGALKGTVAAAHAAGVVAVEIQHSLVSAINPMYRYAPGTGPMATTPDAHLIFGDYWRDEFRGPGRTMVVGFPYYEIEKQAALAEPVDEDEAHRTIIVISDKLYSRSAFVDTAIALARLLPDYTILYKLRPDDYDGWRDRYPPAMQSLPNLRVIDSDEIGLYQYLRRCRWQVGINSTGLYEGLGFGLSTFILRSGWYEEMVPLCEAGHARLVDSAEEIAEVVSGGGFRPVLPDMDRVFAPDSAMRMRSALSTLLSAPAPPIGMAS